MALRKFDQTSEMFALEQPQGLYRVMRIIIAIFLILGSILSIGPAMAAKPVREAPVSGLAKWPDFAKRQSTSLQALTLCEQNKQSCASPEVERWAGLIDNLRGQNHLRQIITVNKWFNRLPYKYDEYAYNTLDYWADTSELLLKRGDCEDFALSKYYTLRQLGFTPEQLKVTVVYDKDSFSNHAVLMVYIDGTRYMMDINGDSTDPTPMETRYRSLYSFNEQTAWYY